MWGVLIAAAAWPTLLPALLHCVCVSVWCRCDNSFSFVQLLVSVAKQARAPLLHTAGKTLAAVAAASSTAYLMAEGSLNATQMRHILSSCMPALVPDTSGLCT